MTLLLELSPTEEQAVNKRARQEGVSPSQLIARVLNESNITTPPPLTPVERALALVREWQRRDGTQFVPSPPGDGKMTPSEVLFRRWEEEDANLTETERQAQVELWEAIQESINSR